MTGSGLRLVVQADGDYSHGRYEADRRDSKVAGNIANNLRQEAYLGCGMDGTAVLGDGVEGRS